jgi:hypothetical protein
MAGRLLLVLVFATTLGAAATPARASELIARNASDVRLAVNADGQALITYRAGGEWKKVLAWDAINAIAPTRERPQVSFKLDYAAGWGTYKRDVSKGFVNACEPYDGPELRWLVTACKAPDGSYWALQSWQRKLPNYGLRPKEDQDDWELRLSHWRGDLPALEVFINWAYRRYHHIFGRFTYLGQPVHGFRATPTGVPLDTFGRNLYVDTFNSAYGRGWRRENSFLMHRGSGAFCYGFYQHGTRPVGRGERYRATIIGPGVTPDMYWEGVPPDAYDRTFDLVANERIRTLGSSLCRPN